MNIGDYVRIKNEAGWCCIGKIENINEFREPDMKYCIDIQGSDLIFISEDMIFKSSPNIIDLIEVGDYVNGCYVLREHYTYMGEHFIELDTNDSWEWGIGNMPTKYIKSIVTHEQFEAIKYEIK